MGTIGRYNINSIMDVDNRVILNCGGIRRDSPVSPHRGSGQLRSHPQRILLRPASRSLCSDPQLLPNWKTSLSNRRLWTALWGGTWVLGTWLQPGRTLLLDDLHSGKKAVIYLTWPLECTFFIIHFSHCVEPRSAGSIRRNSVQQLLNNWDHS